MISQSNIPDISIGETIRVRYNSGEYTDITVTEISQKNNAIVYEGRSKKQKPTTVKSTMAGTVCEGQEVSELIIL